MKPILVITAIISTALTVGCVKHPQNPQEFRKGVAAGAMFTAAEKYTIDRSYDNVVASIEKYAPKCLNARTSHQTRGGSQPSSLGIQYYPKVLAGKNRAELHVQFKTSAQAVGKVPEGGFYNMVVDFVKETKSKTRVEYYGPSGKDSMARAVKGWADGSIKGCPDLTQ